MSTPIFSMPRARLLTEPAERRLFLRKDTITPMGGGLKPPILKEACMCRMCDQIVQKVGDNCSYCGKSFTKKVEVVKDVPEKLKVPLAEVAAKKEVAPVKAIPKHK